MTPDTAALRRDHYDYDSDGHCDDCGERYPCVVRALCDAADEVKRLRAEVEQHRQRANEAARLSSEAVGRIEDADRRWEQHQDVCVMASLDRENLETERDASRTAHAALVADLRALCDEAERAASGRSGVLAAYAAQARKTRALLDRHAPEGGGA